MKDNNFNEVDKTIIRKALVNISDDEFNKKYSNDKESLRKLIELDYERNFDSELLRRQNLSVKDLVNRNFIPSKRDLPQLLNDLYYEVIKHRFDINDPFIKDVNYINYEVLKHSPKSIDDVMVESLNHFSLNIKKKLSAEEKNKLKKIFMIDKLIDLYNLKINYYVYDVLDNNDFKPSDLAVSYLSKLNIEVNNDKGNLKTTKDPLDAFKSLILKETFNFYDEFFPGKNLSTIEKINTVKDEISFIEYDNFSLSSLFVFKYVINNYVKKQNSIDLLKKALEIDPEDYDAQFYLAKDILKIREPEFYLSYYKNNPKCRKFNEFYGYLTKRLK